MISAHDQLDRRLADLAPLATALRPSRGWIRAIRDGLGMTTAQLARRMGVTQPRISELEKAEARGAITMASLERAAEALGCRLAYALIPVEPLGETLHKRAAVIADRQLASVEHTMRLEDQGVTGTAPRAEALRDLIAELQRRPARLWDDG